jgi:hypothetical protein
MTPAIVCALIYAGGVAVGLVRTDARWATRIGLSLLWPLALIAFLVTVAALIAVAVVALPFGRSRSDS